MTSPLLKNYRKAETLSDFDFDGEIVRAVDADTFEPVLIDKKLKVWMSLEEAKNQGYVSR